VKTAANMSFFFLEINILVFYRNFNYKLRAKKPVTLKIYLFMLYCAFYLTFLLNSQNYIMVIYNTESLYEITSKAICNAFRIPAILIRIFVKF